MSNFILDTYTGSAGTSLDSHTPDTGGPATRITSLTGSAQITSANRLRAATSAAIIGYSYAGAPTAADYDVSCDVFIASVPTTQGGVGPVARIQAGAQTYYWARMTNLTSTTGAYDLFKCVAGSYTQLAATSAFAITTGSTTNLKLSLRGSTISLNVSTNGGASYTQVISVTDTSITTAGTAGVGLYNADSSLTDTTGFQLDNLTGVSTVTISPNNSAWTNSPANWIVGTEAITADLGAKRTIVVSGTPSASLTFDLSALVAASIATGSYPQIRYSIDNTPTTDVAVAASVSLFTGLPATSHEIVYEFVRGDYTVDVYNTPVMAIRETGLILGIGGSVSATTDLQPDLMFVAGDSMTAGMGMLSSANPGGGDATATYAKALGPALGAEVGINGKGSVGWGVAGEANVPVFTTEWKNAWSGQARSFPALKRFVVVMGANDTIFSVADSTVTAAVTSWLSDARSTLGSTPWIHVVVPFGGFKRSAITNGVSAYLASHPGDKTVLIDLGTLIQEGLGGAYGTPTRQAPFDGIHPSTITHGQLAAALAPAIRMAETNTNTRSPNNVGGGILGV